MNRIHEIICLLLFGYIFQTVYCGKRCVNWEREDFECEHGCCGDYGKHYCCFHWKVYAIAGGVIGGLVVLGCIVGVVFFFMCKATEANKRATQPYPVVHQVQALPPPVYNPSYTNDSATNSVPPMPPPYTVS